MTRKYTMMVRPLVVFAIAMVASLVAMVAFGTSVGKSGETTDGQTGVAADLKKTNLIRVLLPYSITYFYLENGKKKGAAAAYMSAFEEYLNKNITEKTAPFRIQYFPMEREKIFTALARGLGDIGLGGLTITPERLKLVDFSNPLLEDVRTFIVTGSDHPPITELADIAGMEIHARSTSSYFDSLEDTNQNLKARQLSPVSIRSAPRGLSDADLLEMVNENIISATIMESDKIELWSALYSSIRVHDGLPLKQGEKIGWAVPKDSPDLKKKINQFIKTNKPTAVLPAALFNRDYGESHKLIDPKSNNYLKKFKELKPLFVKFGKTYNIDPAMLAAQAFQESRFNQNARSHVGAVGVMQMLPSTARDKHVGIRDIYKLKENIEAGAKYMRFLMDHYFDDTAISNTDQLLLAFAAYNAGPHRVLRARKNVPNPNKWFNNVEWEVGRLVGSQPLNYVRNIYIYHMIFSDLDVFVEGHTSK
ncbi:MAG: lytic transglycosylase F [Stappiaceae bacterium]